MKQFKFKKYGFRLIGTHNLRLRLRNLFIVGSAAFVLSACANPEDEAVSAGALTYRDVCKVCHAQGINGAPILGNKKMWSKRAPQGLETLVEHAMNGYGLMPAKGGRTELTKDDVTNAVKYMLSQLESK